ncbi:MAG: hypothetical protein IJZ34_10225 [Lachnospiraceae bacterium]|nr:hypothetical protein [Lachnospiraceae bacterium]
MSKKWCSSYDTGDMIYFSNGQSGMRYGNVTYYDNIHSVTEGVVTYYFDKNYRRLGRSVDNRNGTYTYFDDNGREIGHSVRNGRITDYLGNCFPL